MDHVDNRSPFPEDPNADLENGSTTIGGRDVGAGFGYPAGGIRDKASAATEDVAEDIKSRAESARKKAGNAIGEAGEWIRENADSLPGEAPRRYARQAGDGIRESGTYIRDHDMNDMAHDVENVVRQHPLPSLLTVAAIGILLGRSMRHS
jgi:ElaB/YqjD/DUF883 family membrane-anchored ribosome-binding protein